jgi:hypothetical protein
LQPARHVIAAIGEIEGTRLEVRLDEAEEEFLVRTSGVVQGRHVERSGLDGEDLEVCGRVYVCSQDTRSTLTSGDDDKVVRLSRAA